MTNRYRTTHTHLCPRESRPPEHDASANDVDVDDLLAVILSWGACPPPQQCPGNIINSGTSVEHVDVDDLLAVIIGWGRVREANIAPLGPPQGDCAVGVNDLVAVIINWGLADSRESPTCQRLIGNAQG